MRFYLHTAHHEDTVIHTETGSGKTLAYLVPILSRLEPGLPLQLLVLLPSRELALQVATGIDVIVTYSPTIFSEVADGNFTAAAAGAHGSSNSTDLAAGSAAQEDRVASY